MGKVPAPTPEMKDDLDGRRRLLTILSGFGLLGSAVLSALSSFVFINPRATFGQPSRFQVGKPDEFPSGTKLALEDRRSFLIHESAQIAVIPVCVAQLAYDGPTVGVTNRAAPFVFNIAGPKAAAVFRVHWQSPGRTGSLGRVRTRETKV